MISSTQIIIILFCVLLAIALVLYLQRNQIRSNTIRMITGAHDKPRGKLRTKDLQKFPRTKSEGGVIRTLEEITGGKFPTYYPKWLVWRGKTLELDGYNEKLKLALEFSGPLHTKWYPEREPYTVYFERLVRDVVKKRLCRKHGVNLIVVDMSLPPKHWRDYLVSRLYDYGFIKDKPIVYIEEQIAKPYRNEQIEKELSLTHEMDRANRL